MKLFLGLPAYGFRRYNTMPLLEMYRHQKSFERITVMENDRSALTLGFNELLVHALELRDAGQADFFLLMHSDIVPVDRRGWLDQLMSARRDITSTGQKCEVLSAVSPIKDGRGATSTAVEGYTVWSPHGFTMTEIMAKPETFTEPDLLVNTGLLLIDLRKNEWIEKICFTVRNGIMTLKNGKREAVFQSEDWDFSRQARALGVTLWATRKVALHHQGEALYANYMAWGTEKTLPFFQPTTGPSLAE